MFAAMTEKLSSMMIMNEAPVDDEILLKELMKLKLQDIWI